MTTVPPPGFNKPFNEMDHRERLTFIELQAKLDPESPLAYAWRTVLQERKVAIYRESFKDRVAASIVAEMARGETSPSMREHLCQIAYDWADTFVAIRNARQKAQP